MERDHYFESADEALVFCNQLIEAGAVDLFRGQTKDWTTITPSLLRGDDEQRTKAAEILEQFIEWANAVPQMGRYWGNDQQITAIAQHYGIPTSYLDLTTSPAIAAAFAALAEGAESDEQAVIYCFRRADIASLRYFRILEVDVANLWRLRAQRGLFLEVMNGADLELLRTLAIRIYFPARVLRDDEKRTIYPPRKSALEIVIDQWSYRHIIGVVLNNFTSSDRRLMIRRYTYPGVARWRSIPEFDPSWVNWDVGWVFQEDAEVINPPPDSRHRVILPLGLSIHDAFDHLKKRIIEILVSYKNNAAGLEFEIIIKGRESESIMGTTVFNRCWDGLRVHPYSDHSVVQSLAATGIALLWGIEHPDQDWERELWGEIESIDVAPIGGHLDSASVSRKSYFKSLRKSNCLSLTAYSQRKYLEDPLYINNLIVDHWLIFEFDRFSRMFVEEYIPSCIGWYWKACIESGDQKLNALWAVSFNPALLGFVTLSRYRFYSPVSAEADVDHVVLISSDMSEDDIEEAFISCLPAILGGGKPFTVKFTDYGSDDREIWEIPQAIDQCRIILKIGGISVLDVFPEMRDLEAPEPTNPSSPWERKGLCALQIWAIACGRLKEINGVRIGELKDLLQIFWRDLEVSNAELERRGRKQPDWPCPGRSSETEDVRT